MVAIYGSPDQFAFVIEGEREMFFRSVFIEPGHCFAKLHFFHSISKRFCFIDGYADLCNARKCEHKVRYDRIGDFLLEESRKQDIDGDVIGLEFGRRGKLRDRFVDDVSGSVDILDFGPKVAIDFDALIGEFDA